MSMQESETNFTSWWKHGELSPGGGVHSLGLCFQTHWTNILLFHSPVVCKHCICYETSQNGLEVAKAGQLVNG